VPIRDVDRLVGQYGGSAGDWAKIRSSNFKAADGTSFEIHAYRNVRTGEAVELKTKFQ
jgi:filamentous hemagglutinin